MEPGSGAGTEHWWDYLYNTLHMTIIIVRSQRTEEEMQNGSTAWGFLWSKPLVKTNFVYIIIILFCQSTGLSHDGRDNNVISHQIKTNDAFFTLITSIET